MILQSTSSLSRHSEHLRSTSTSTLVKNDKGRQSVEPLAGPTLKGHGPSHDRLRFLGFTLHLVLILVHLALLVTWRVHAEHNIIFAVRLQGIVSFLVTALATAVGTLYLSLLVYITQKFALQRTLQFGRTLTAAHDNVTAWIGLGSGLETLFDQIAVPSSAMSILLIVGYLLNISVLHVTIPALFSVQTFNISSPTTITTEGLPQSSTILEGDGCVGLPDVLQFLPWTNQVPTLGLINGSLYEVLEVNDGQGSVSVPGVGFNITCNSLAATNTGAMNVTSNSSNSLLGGLETLQWEIKLDIPPSTSWFFQLLDTAPNITRFVHDISSLDDYIVFYSTTPVVDSNGVVGVPTTLNPPMTNVSELYFLQCFKTRVPQTSQVDCRSRESVSLAPDIRKEWAVWRQTNSSSVAQNSTESDPDMTKGNCWSTLLDMYSSDTSPILSNIPYSLDIARDIFAPTFLSLADVYLMDQLGLHFTFEATPQEKATQIALHDIENALSSLVASILWTVGHIHSGQFEEIFEQSSAQLLGDSYSVPVLATGTAIVDVPNPASRLDLSILAIAFGLAASICLFLLAVPHLHPGSTEGMKTLVDGTGLLHIIWLLRKYPELEELFPDVGEPTKQNLRAAGMVDMGVGIRDSEENATRRGPTSKANLYTT
ncbi:hypothetical protein MVEN_01177500 [Mycena venus]|uniref:Uncharacterized protein n=1 Tax=Mycena venus TaxID=2733690 RepID=A0A8H6Y155_9AGAR|nr:hypothetical protein MVEN_01177500 [Mycena venus]